MTPNLPQPPMPCTPNQPSCPQAHDAADEAAKKAVKEVFAILGVDVDTPREVEEFRKDLRFGASMRRATDKGMLAFLGIVAFAVILSILPNIGALISGGR